MVAAILLVVVSGAAPAGEYTEVQRTPAEVKRGDECDRLHSDLRKKLPDDERAQRDAWVAEKPRCAGTGLYEYLLGTHERHLGNDSAAIAIFEDAVKRKLPFYESVYVSLNTMYAEAAFTAKPPDLERVRVLRKELMQFAAAHKPDAFAYQQLAAYAVTLKDWPAAVEAARGSIELDRMAGKADRYLVFSLHASQRCPEAVKEIGPAIENSPELLADPQFMLSAADCYAETGQIETGEKALNALLRNNPSMKDNAGVIQLQKFFVSKKPAGPATPAAPKD